MMFRTPTPEDSARKPLFWSVASMAATSSIGTPSCFASGAASRNAMPICDTVVFALDAEAASTSDIRLDSSALRVKAASRDVVIAAASAIPNSPAAARSRTAGMAPMIFVVFKPA